MAGAKDLGPLVEHYEVHLHAQRTPAFWSCDWWLASITFIVSYRAAFRRDARLLRPPDSSLDSAHSQSFYAAGYS